MGSDNLDYNSMQCQYITNCEFFIAHCRDIIEMLPECGHIYVEDEPIIYEIKISRTSAFLKCSDGRKGSPGDSKQV
jgi:hypothetical protein